MKIYYAHHIWKYNTEIEKYEIDLIKKYFPTDILLNPNGDLGYTENSGLTETEIMKICLDTKYDVLVFSSMDGVVGHGVYNEVNHAIKLHKDIYYLNNNIITHITKVEWKLLNLDNNRLFAIIQNMTL
jgi:hypothetical protein